MGHSENKF